MTKQTPRQLLAQARYSLHRLGYPQDAVSNFLAPAQRQVDALPKTPRKSTAKPLLELTVPTPGVKPVPEKLAQPLLSASKKKV